MAASHATLRWRLQSRRSDETWTAGRRRWEVRIAEQSRVQLEAPGHVRCDPPRLEEELSYVGRGQFESDRLATESCQGSSRGGCEAKDEWGTTGITGRGGEVGPEARAGSAEASQLREHAFDFMLAQVRRQSFADENGWLLEDDAAFGKDLIERAFGEVGCEEQRSSRRCERALSALRVRVVDLDELHTLASESPRAGVVTGGEDRHPSYARIESVGNYAVVEASSCGDPRADPAANPPASPRAGAKDDSFPTTNEQVRVKVVEDAKRREVRSGQSDVLGR